MNYTITPKKELDICQEVPDQFESGSIDKDNVTQHDWQANDEI